MMLTHVPLTLLSAILSLSPPPGALPPPAAADDSKPHSATCSFSNVQYSGWCRVTEDIPEGSTADEVCQKALNCLNDTSCMKTYCNATNVRGGWKLEKVEAQ